jgi:hypothetical protein
LLLAESLPDLDVASSDERVRENAKTLGFKILPVPVG